MSEGLPQQCTLLLVETFPSERKKGATMEKTVLDLVTTVRLTSKFLLWVEDTSFRIFLSGRWTELGRMGSFTLVPSAYVGFN